MRLALSVLVVAALWACYPNERMEHGDAGPPTNGCTAESFIARKGASDDRRIGFGTALDSPAFGYSPPCLTIAAGQSVTFVGNFSTHPLSPGEYNGDGGTPPSPITRLTMGQADNAVTFAIPGTYPYYCELHAPTMAGVVKVE